MKILVSTFVSLALAGAAAGAPAPQDPRHPQHVVPGPPAALPVPASGAAGSAAPPSPLRAAPPGEGRPGEGARPGGAGEKDAADPAVIDDGSAGEGGDEGDDGSAGAGGSDRDAPRRVRVNARAFLTLPAGTIEVIYPLLPADGPDAAAIAALEDGEVLELTRSMALKLETEVAMRFAGGLVARPGNVATDYPGVYSLWLRRKEPGWAMVVNEEPDIWGTMRDPEADVGETPVEYRHEAGAGAPVFEVSLAQTNGGGELTIAWGPHRWSAHFEAAAGAAGAAEEAR